MARPIHFIWIPTLIHIVSHFSFSYIVDLYKVTPEYYRFLKSINDAQSNSWADVGLMQVTPTYSNVKGGFGVVAGYNISSVSKFF